MALVDLRTIPAGRQFRIPILVPILALALVTTNRVFANGIPVTIVQIISRALICIHTLAFSIASIKAILAGAQTLDTNGVVKRRSTVCIGCTGNIVVLAVGHRFWLGRWEYTSCDAISFEIVIASANEAVVGCRGSAGCVDMTWRSKTLVCRNALDGAPLDWHRILDHCRRIVGEYRFVSFATTTFITFRWDVVNAKETLFGTPGARVRRLDTFINVRVAVEASKSIDAATHGVTSVGF